MTHNTLAMLEKAKDLFVIKFGIKPELATFAPGRANLIGEHTDYNDGFVLPFALPYKTIFVAGRSRSEFTTIFSTAIPDAGVTFKIDKNLCVGEPSWANYVKGTIYQYLEDLPIGVAFNAVIISDVPLGSGLSSSAALEVATATMLQELYDLPRGDEHSSIQKALRCQKAEHDFAGTPCGIMDQYISSLGKEGHMLLIDCRTNNASLVPCGDGADSPVIVVTNSNVKHSLSGSEYPDRVNQCREAVQVLKRHYPEVIALRDANLSMLEHVKHELSDIVFRRARHVISENQRTLNAVDALQRRDYKAVGELMNQSHDSLRDDYEVSCDELDSLVRYATGVPGVLGSRMTGGGFGGCTVTLVHRYAIQDLEEVLREKFFEDFNKRCDCYEAVPSAGAGILSINVEKLEESKRPNWIDYLAPATVIAVSLSIAISYLLRRR